MRRRIPEVVHAATQTEHQVKRRLLLDVVVGERAAVLELPAREDEALLVKGDTLLVLDLALHHLDGVARFHLQGGDLVTQILDEDLVGIRTQTEVSK